jgi:predicted metalloendopeptidase
MGLRRHLPLFTLLSLLPFAGVVTARSGSQTASKAATPDEAAVHGIDPADMDRTARPCDDFYRYADGGWQQKNPIPPEYPSWGTFNELAERNREALHKILETLAREKHSAGSEEQKLGDFYASCMEEAEVETAGAKPLQPELARIEKVRSLTDLEGEVARLQTRGVNALFGFGSQQDRKNSNEVIGGASQGGLALPDRDYYTNADEKSKTLRDQYRAHVKKMFGLLGDPPERAAAEASTVLAIETKLAEASMTRVERRDPDATYHRMDPDQLKSLTPNFSWISYLHDIEAPSVVAVNIGQPKFFEALNAQLASVPISDWKTYLRWHLVHAAAPALASRFVQEDFEFFFQDAPGDQGNPAAVEALRPVDRQEPGVRSREALRAGALPAGGKGKRRSNGEEPDRGASGRSHDTALDGRGDEEGGPGKAQCLQSQDRPPGTVARLFLIRGVPWLVSHQRDEWAAL